MTTLLGGEGWFCVPSSVTVRVDETLLTRPFPFNSPPPLYSLGGCGFWFGDLQGGRGGLWPSTGSLISPQAQRVAMNGKPVPGMDLRRRSLGIADGLRQALQPSSLCPARKTCKKLPLLSSYLGTTAWVGASSLHILSPFFPMSQLRQLLAGMRAKSMLSPLRFVVASFPIPPSGNTVLGVVRSEIHKNLQEPQLEIVCVCVMVYSHSLGFSRVPCVSLGC